MAYRSMCPILWGPTGAVESFNVLPMETTSQQNGIFVLSTKD
jgi:hypothetical protein